MDEIAAVDEIWHRGRRRCLGRSFRLGVADARRFYAGMLLARGAPGDTDRASELLLRAEEIYRQARMPHHLELAETLRQLPVSGDD